MAGAIFGTLAGIAGGAIQGAINNRQNQENNAQAAALNYHYGELSAQSADKRTRALYNDLYSPQAKVAQLKAAGLSPGLMYGMAGGAGGTTSTAGAQGQGAGGQQGKMSQFDFMQYALMDKQAKLLDAQAENQKAEAEKHEAEANKTKGVDTQKAWAEIQELAAKTNNEQLQAELTEAQKLYQEIQNDIADSTKQVQIDTIIQQLEALTKQNAKAEQEIKALKLSNEITEATKKDMIEQVKLTNRNLAKDLLVKQAQINLTDAEIKNLQETMRLKWKELEQQNLDMQKRVEMFNEQLKYEAQKLGIEAALTEKGYKVQQRTAIINGVGHLITGIAIAGLKAF